MAKILGCLLKNTVVDKLPTDSLQFAYKQKCGTEFATTFITKVLSEFLEGGSDVYIVSLNVSAAFHDLRHQQLFSSLKKINIDTQILGTLKDHYGKGKARLKVNDKVSKDFALEKCVRQGGLLPPYLCDGYTAELSSKLEEAKVECVVGSTFCRLAGYADDFNIICNPYTHLLRAVDISIEYFNSEELKDRRNCK